MTDFTKIDAQKLIRMTIKRCGHCKFWLEQSCPRSYVNMQGFDCGPSINEAACQKYEPSERTQNAEVELCMRQIHYGSEYKLH